MLLETRKVNNNVYKKNLVILQYLILLLDYSYNWEQYNSFISLETIQFSHVHEKVMSLLTLYLSRNLTPACLHRFR